MTMGQEMGTAKPVKSDDSVSSPVDPLVPALESGEKCANGRKKRVKWDPDNECASPLIQRDNKKAKRVIAESDCRFDGAPFPALEAQKKWPSRCMCKVKKGDVADEDVRLQARCHYKQAIIDGVLFKLGDDAYVQAEEGKPDYIAKIIEMFETLGGEQYFRAQWFYRAEDTVIKNHANLVDNKRVFLSDIEDDNPLNCIVSKVKIAQVAPNMDPDAKAKILLSCDLYCDMKYKLSYLTFSNMITENSKRDSDASSPNSSEGGSHSTIDNISNDNSESQKICKSEKSKLLLLDLYSGCGAMSTGLSMGASLSGTRLITRWAVDINSHACKSLKKNHHETEVRNEAAEDFLSLLKEWEKLCQKFGLISTKGQLEPSLGLESEEVEEEKEEDGDDDSDSEIPSEEFEVERFLAICSGDPNKVNQSGLHLKVRWKGYGPSEDTWEPTEGLSKCTDKLKEFVTQGYKSNILPLPGGVDFICGGPPCQGISGFNRFRNQEAPLDDIKNHQLVVYMDIIDHLKPKYVLMENVVDIVKFAGGFLARYAVGRLVSMNYQTRLGMMAAGSYGVPQFRMRVFLWGACHSEKLPPYPLPTHEVLSKGVIPTEFEDIVVAHDKKQPCKLEKALDLNDALSDLPPVTNEEKNEEIKYQKAARTEFQRYIRLRKADMITHTASANGQCPHMLYDHQPLQLNDDDYERVCRIPKKKGANFRDLPGVVVGEDNKVEWDKTMERVLVKSGKPLVPNYAMKFVNGRSLKPFGRLWWDEIVNTVVTRAEPHNQSILHPEQDRVLTIRENARLQGFPDCYKLYGSIKERYIQVGNAVAVPVATALGYAFGLASQGLCDDQPLITLPFKFPNCLKQSPQNEED